MPVQTRPGQRQDRHPADPATRGNASLEDRHPDHQVAPEPRTRDGHEWSYVLSGRMRFILGDQDWVLGPGEVAAFDTNVPHWFGSTGDEPAEILSIFGSDGPANE